MGLKPPPSLKSWWVHLFIGVDLELCSVKYYVIVYYLL